MHKMINELNMEIKLNNMGKEKMILTHLTDFDIKNSKIKLYSFVQLNPGEEIQFHTHVGESETYFILSGYGIYNDNGNIIEAVSGLVTFTPSGHGHGIKNTGTEVLVLIALILYD